MRRTPATAMALLLLLLPVGATAQDRDTFEADAPWGEAETMTLVSSGVDTIFGVENDDYCRFVFYLTTEDDASPEPG